MADAAAKREARRKRILENSENRLQKITGRARDDSEKDKSSENLNLRSLRNQSNEDLTSEVQALPAGKYDRPDIEHSEQLSFHLQYEQPHLRRVSPIQDKTSSQNGERKTSDTNSSSIDLESVAVKTHHSLLYRLFAGPFACILLAAVMNILVLCNSDPTSSKGILVPWTVIAITRWFLRGDSQEVQSSGILVAALILCNVRPSILHRLKTIFIFTSIISKDFALYITSFVLFNWLFSIFQPDVSYIQFPS